MATDAVVIDRAAVTEKLNLLGYHIHEVADTIDVACDPPPQAGRFTTVTVTITLADTLACGQGFAVFTPYAFSKPQLTLPNLEGYTTIRTTGSARLEGGGFAHPGGWQWERGVQITVCQSDLKAGDQMIVTFGDTSQGSPGARCPLRALRANIMECFRLSRKDEQPESIMGSSPMVRVAPGGCAIVRGFATQSLGVGETGRLQLVAEDAYGNATPDFTGTVQLRGLPDGWAPETVTFQSGDRGCVTVPFTPDRPGVFYPTVLSGGGSVCAGPVEVTADPPALRLFFGELHAHSELSYDARGEADEFYTFARDTAGLDFAAMTDHMIATVNCGGTPGHASTTPALRYAEMPRRWTATIDAARRFHEPGRFVTFVGFEANSVGPANHRNVYWKDDGEIYDMGGADYGDPAAFAKWTQSRDVLVVPHHPAIAWNPGKVNEHGACRFDEVPASCQPIVEMYSKHGTSEHLGNHRPLRGQAAGGFVHDLLNAGHRFGFVAGSDTHWGNPGSSMIDAGPFDTLQYRSGLAAVWARELTREAIWEAIFARRTFATTYHRVVLRFSVNGVAMGEQGHADYPRTAQLDLYSPVHVNRIELIRNGEVLAAHPPRNHPDMPAYAQGRIEIPDDQPSGRPIDWYYVRVWLVNGERAWSSPVWLENA